MSVTLTDRLSTFEVASASTLSNGLTACWKMDETLGTTLYDSIGSNDLTDVTGTINQAGIDDKAVTYSQQTAIINSSPTASESEISIALWIYPNDVKSISDAVWGEYYDAVNYYFQFWITTGRFFHRTVTTGYNGARVGDLSFTVVEGQWNLIVCTYSVANTLKAVYVNGSLVDSTSSGVTQLTSERTTMKLAKDDETAGNWFDGKIDETLVWDRPLTSDEVTELWNSGSGKFYPF